MNSVQNVTITCVDDDGDGFADIKYSASWRIQGANELCLSPLAAYPANASKCKAGIPNSPIAIASQTIDVIKVLNPPSDPGLFDLEIDAAVVAADSGNGDSSGPTSVAPGVRTVSESAGTGTVLGDYSSDIVCVETVGSCVVSTGVACLNDATCDAVTPGDTCDLTPTTVASCTGCTSVPVTVPGVQSAIACTITNSNACAGVDCSGLDDACNVGQCNPGTGTCEAIPVVDGTACDDATVCNGAELCQAGVCQAGTPLACDNGLFCDGTEICDSIADCVAGPPVDCSDGVSCTIDACDEVNDLCQNAPDHLSCDNGLFCDGTEVCDVIADCVPGAPVDCSDGVACTVDTCDEANDLCQNAPGDLVCDDGIGCTLDSCSPTLDCVNATDDGFCSNGVFCDGEEICNPLLGCEAGFAVVCPDDGFSCTNEFCDEGTAQCVADNTCVCGNTLLEPGEQCDPATSLEDCNNMIDDDGDGDIDCADSDCRDPNNAALGIDTCGLDCNIDLACQPILKDPARFIFGRNGRLDRFKIHGRMLRMSSADLAQSGFAIMVTNANGVILSEALPAGQMKQTSWGGSYIFKNRDARLEGGILRVRVKNRTIRGVPHIHFTVKVFGDYSAASLSTMTTQVVVGGHTATLTRDWEVTRRGWLLRDSAF